MTVREPTETETHQPLARFTLLEPLVLIATFGILAALLPQFDNHGSLWRSTDKRRTSDFGFAPHPEQYESQ